MPPAARVTDMHTCPMVTVLVPHVGGPILPPGVPTVLIGFLPAATVTNMAVCVGPPDVIVKGSAGVFINFLPAARMGDLTAHGGVIVLGFPTVIIGEIGSPSPGAAGLGGIVAGLAVAGVTTPSASQPSVYSTQDAAASAALAIANPLSKKANLEYAGLIYKDAAGGYHFTKAVQGSDQGANPYSSPAPAGTTVVGDYHTHGDYSTAGPKGEAVRTGDPAKDDFNSDHFSGADKRGITKDGAGQPDYRGYLGTPSGKFLSFNPTTGQEENLP